MARPKTNKFSFKLKEYGSWKCMRNRCNNRKHKDYWLYGGRGIKVCDRWENSFDNFMEDMGHKPTNEHSLDRIDNDKGYSKENCRWASRLEQQNNRRNNTTLDYGGKKIPAKELSKNLGISITAMRRRIKKGYPIEKILIPNKINVKLLTHNGKTQSLVKWAEDIGIKHKTLRARINDGGWSVEKALTTPLAKNTNKPTLE